MTVRKKSAKAAAGEVISLSPTPPIRLASIDDVRVEMARLYRDARRNALPLSDASKLAFILGQLVKVMELQLIERRVDEIESAMEASNEAMG